MIWLHALVYFTITLHPLLACLNVKLLSDIVSFTPALNVVSEGTEWWWSAGLMDVINVKRRSLRLNDASVKTLTFFEGQDVLSEQDIVLTISPL